MVSKLADNRYKLPLTPDEQQEILGKLLSAQAKIEELCQRIQRLEQGREELTALVQELMPHKKVLFKT